MLLMWSGGVESTSLLKQLLTETDEKVNAVHVSCPTSAGRVHLEWGAVCKLEPRLQQIRPFTLHRVDISFPFDVRDSEVQVVVLPALLRHLGETQFMKGLCLEDWKDEAGYAGPAMTEATNRARFGRRIADLVLGYMQHDKNHYAGVDLIDWKQKTWEDLSPYHESMHWHKAEHMRYLGPELLALTWSCLTPVRGSPCGECGTCKLRSAHQPAS